MTSTLFYLDKYHVTANYLISQRYLVKNFTKLFFKMKYLKFHFQRIELGAMARMFFNKFGMILFYLCMIVYLYGDLAIYAAAVPKNVVSILCNNLTCRENMSLPASNLSAPCK